MLAVYLPSFLVKKCINIKFHIRTFELFSNRQIIEHHSFENLKIYKVGSEQTNLIPSHQSYIPRISFTEQNTMSLFYKYKNELKEQRLFIDDEGINIKTRDKTMSRNS